MANNAKINILGNLTKDPETRDYNGSTVATLMVAVNTDAKNPDGTFKTDFYEVSVWGKQGEYLMQRLQKGSSVWVTGGLSTNEYVGRDQQKHFTLRVRADDVRGVARLKGGETAAKQTARSTSDDQGDEMPF